MSLSENITSPKRISMSLSVKKWILMPHNFSTLHKNDDIWIIKCCVHFFFLLPSVIYFFFQMEKLLNDRYPSRVLGFEKNATIDIYLIRNVVCTWYAFCVLNVQQDLNIADVRSGQSGRSCGGLLVHGGPCEDGEGGGKRVEAPHHSSHRYRVARPLKRPIKVTSFKSVPSTH